MKKNGLDFEQERMEMIKNTFLRSLCFLLLIDTNLCVLGALAR